MLYDSTVLGELRHQLCCQHLLRDLASAGEIYPEATWPGQIAEVLRGLIHEANLARQEGLAAIPLEIKNPLITQFHNALDEGLAATLSSQEGRPGQRSARLVLEVLRDREADVLRFAHDLKVPPTSNQAERDLGAQ